MRKKETNLTEKELQVMQILWQHGPMFVKEMLTHYPEPVPHVNTVSTVVRILEDKGYVKHEAVGGSFRYEAAVAMDQCREKSFTKLVSNFFNNSYKSAVSALVEEEKISVDDLRDIIRMIESGHDSRKED
ncbi:MAG: BlaI/MecI/CopY family transcriptional regulator [Bacteroides sp.]|nr:BlaI/MecI/CopY family transcriptional regulator [Barnesiella sp.]MBD5254059.1 BlaI/MecI/CopY family transcriptional regulator [Barnesiella sp.]MBD5343901.1 BlaI/MecI/CopY family transcriptional regulator [Bacteroides sp.]MBD5369359.1 BlaI/MecI/CopY family transcriptional regulator [Bacteroides sp.]